MRATGIFNGDPPLARAVDDDEAVGRPAQDPATEIPDVKVPSAEEAESLAASAPESSKAKRLFAKGTELARNPGQARMLLEDAMRKAKRNEGALGKVWSELQILFSFVKDSVAGRYKPDAASLGLAIGAILYFLSPLDVIPDFIAGVGFLDDAAIIAFAVHRLRDELGRYRAWRDTMGPDHSSGSADAVHA